MSEDNTATAEADNAGFTPPATQEEFNRIINERVKREREKYADYGDLKAKASKLDEIEKANQSELERAQQEAAAARAELEAERLNARRLQIANDHKITGDYLDLLSGSDEQELTEKATKIAALIAAQEAPQSGVRELVVPGEGKSPAALNSDELEAALRSSLGVN